MILAGAASLVALQSQVTNAIDFGEQRVEAGLQGDSRGADSAVQTLISNAITFLYLVAVVYALWGGFQILTAGGDEEKVKKGKTILVQAVIGLIVIFLASSIINWVVNSLLGA